MTTDNLDIDRILEAVENDELVGFCAECGEEHSNVEPDARSYLCDCCDQYAVYGATEILLNLV